MSDRYPQDESPLAAERGRSPSGAASGGPAAHPLASPPGYEQQPTPSGGATDGQMPPPPAPAQQAPSGLSQAGLSQAGGGQVGGAEGRQIGQAGCPRCDSEQDDFDELDMILDHDLDLDLGPPRASGDDSHAAEDGAGEESASPQGAVQEAVQQPVQEPFEEPVRAPGLAGRRRSKSRRLVQPQDAQRQPLSPQQRLLILDTWQRSGLPAGDFASMVGLSKHTLYAWKKKFDEQGPAGLMDQPRGSPAGSRLPELTRRTILMLKKANPAWGCQRISDMLLRGPALPASPSAIARVLHEEGYELEEVPTHPHPDKVRRFERAKPNQLWQTDLFTFILKRQNRRVYLVAFMDDHSRFLVSYGLHASQSSALVLEVLRAGITTYGTPEEILTDNGSQYVTWRGKSAFTKELEKRGVRQVVASPRRPQTLGKIERFWGTLWRECLEASVFLDMEDARRRIGHFIDYYNFQRAHQGIDGLVPADRFFGATSEVLRTLKERVAANALELARHGTPKPPFYMTGQVGGRAFSVHADGERVILKREGQSRQEVELVRPEPPPTPAAFHTVPPAVCPDGSPVGELPEESLDEGLPGQSPLDQGLRDLKEHDAPPPRPDADTGGTP